MAGSVVAGAAQPSAPILRDVIQGGALNVQSDAPEASVCGNLTRTITTACIQAHDAARVSRTSASEPKAELLARSGHGNSEMFT